MTDWASRYNSSGSSGGGTDWSSRFNSGSSSGAKKKSSGGWFDSIASPVSHFLGGSGPLGGVESVIGNAGGQAMDIVHGLPNLYHLPGMVKHDFTTGNRVSLIDLLQNPSAGIRKINRELHDPKGFVGASYMPVESDVGALRRGDWHYFQKNPLNPVLDVATVLSLGGGGALKLARAGTLGERAAGIANAERVLSKGEGAAWKLGPAGKGEVQLNLRAARTLQGRIRQNWFDRYSIANPEAKWLGVNVGIDARAGRILNQRAAVSMLRARLPVRQFQRLTQKLTPSEKFAFHVAAEDVPLQDRIAFYKAQIAIRPTNVLRKYVKQLESPGVAEALANPRPEFTAALWKGHELESAAGQRLVESGVVSPESRVERAAMPREMMTGATPDVANSIHPDFPPAFRFWHTGGGKSLEGQFSNPGTERMLGKVPALGQAKRSVGARLQAAAFETNPERVLSTDYLSTMRHEMILGMQKEALLPISERLSAAHVDTGYKPEDWFYFRPSFDRKATAPVDRSVREAEKLTQDRAALDTELQQSSIQGASEGVVSQKLSDLGIDAKDAKDLEKLDRLGIRMVPSAYGKDFLREFHGTSRFIRNFIDRPLDVWRAITLNFRPAWFVNNLVGNTVMGILSHPSSALHYLQTLKLGIDGDKKLRTLYLWTKDRPRIYRKYGQLFQEVAPELHSAGLFGTQTRVTAKGIYEGGFRANPAVRALGFVPKKLGQGVMKVGRGITKAEVLFAEDTGREAVFISAAGGDIAKIRATAKAMGEGNISLAEAIRRMDRDSIERAINAVNDALGNFNDLNHTERAVIRRMIPFYSWYKVITKVSAKYAARYPARLKLLQSIDQAQNTDGETPLPSWLVGSIMLGKPKAGTQSLISTQGINPYETLPQAAAGGFVGLANPLVGAGVIAAGGRNAAFGTLQDYYGPGATNRPGYPGQIERGAGALFGSLAPVRLLLGETQPYSGRLYDPKTYHRNLLLQYLGLPLRDVKVQEAKRERGL